MSAKKDTSRFRSMLERRDFIESIPDEESAATDETEFYGEPGENQEELKRRFFTEEKTAYEPEPAYTPEVKAVPRYESAPREVPASENTLDEFLEISDIYRRMQMPLSGTDTIYLIEEYIATLPDSLPAEMRRSIVLKIVAASGFDFDRMLNDGINRVTKLNDYSADFNARSEDIVASYNAEIEALNRKISEINERINERKNLHKRQFLTLEGEAQRLKEVLDFITK